MSLENHLFVYGTLLRNSSGSLHPFLQDHADYLGDAYLPGKLYDVGNYPGAVLDLTTPSAKVFGEVYALRREQLLLQKLDDYEECAVRFPAPHEYLRSQQTVTLRDGNRLLTWIYLYNRPTAGLQRIVCGDYRQYLREKS